LGAITNIFVQPTQVETLADRFLALPPVSSCNWYRIKMTRMNLEKRKIWGAHFFYRWGR